MVVFFVIGGIGIAMLLVSLLVGDHLHGVFDAGIYLLLYRSVLYPSTGHVVLSESAVASRSIVTVIDFMPWRRVPIPRASTVG